MNEDLDTGNDSVVKTYFYQDIKTVQKLNYQPATCEQSSGVKKFK